MSRIHRSLPLALLVVAVLGVPAAAQSPIPSPSPLAPDALTASWAQVVERPDGGTDIVVGQLGGVAWTALSVDTTVQTFGPVRGQLLAWWRDGDRTIVRTIDRVGRSRELARTPDRIGAASLSPDGDRWYWATLRPNRGTAAIFRARTYPEHPDARTRLARGRRQTPDRMVWLGSERLLGVEMRTAIGYRLSVLDTTSRRWTTSPVEGAQRVIGLSGDALVAGTTTPDGAVGAPLVAIDQKTGAARPITTARGTGAFVTDTGTALWDEIAADGSSTVWSASDLQLDAAAWCRCCGRGGDGWDSGDRRLVAAARRARGVGHVDREVTALRSRLRSARWATSRPAPTLGGQPTRRPPATLGGNVSG